MTSPLLLLAEKVEGLEGADREVDVAITCAVFKRNVGHRKWTASLDAAMSLVPQGLHPGVSENIWHLHWHAWMGRQDRDGSPDDVANANAATPALALTAAALRARAAMEAGE